MSEVNHMVKMIHERLGTVMYVSEENVEKFKEAGHRLASAPPAAEKPKRTTKAKTAKK